MYFVSDKTCRKDQPTGILCFCVQRAAMLDYNTDYCDSYPFELLLTLISGYDTISSKIPAHNLTSKRCPFLLLVCVVYSNVTRKGG